MVANIVSVNSIDVSQDFNVVDSMDKIIHGLPTLIVGYNLVDKAYPDFDILDICVTENIYWTFKKTEKRDKFTEDLDWFITKVYNDLVKDINYVFVDPIQFRPQTIIKIIRKIYNIKNIITYVNDNMVYIYGEKLIFGVDLRLLRFMGVDTNKLLNKLKEKSADFLIDKEILIEYKKTVETLDNKARYIPYLFSIRNGENNTTSLVHIP